MADLSAIKLPNNESYNLKDSQAREMMPVSASVDSSGVITFKNSSNNSVFTLQLPLYNGGVV